MKVFIVFFLIFSSFNSGIDAQSSNTTSTTTTSTSTKQSTTTLSTPSPTTTTPPPSPAAEVGVNVTWTFNNGTKVTSVIMTVTNLKRSQWAAIGLGQTQAMNEAHVFICQRDNNDAISIGRYINPGEYEPPEGAGSEQGGVFTPLSPQFTDGVVVCQFTLSNFTTQTFKEANDLQPLSPSRSYYPLCAIGPLESDANDIGKHYHDSRVALPDTVQLSQTETILYKVHSTNATNTTTTLSTPSPITTTASPSPAADVGVNVTWTFNNGTEVTSVIMTVTNLQRLQWAAIGLGQTQTMNEAHVFICQRDTSDTISIGRYINPGEYEPPEGAGSEQGGVFTPLPPQFMNGVIVCQFTLSNFTTQTFKQANDLQPLSPSRSYYPLLAIGPLQTDANDIGKHYHDSRVALPDKVQLNQTETILYKVPKPTPGPGDSMTYYQAHGIIMVFAWIFFVSTGVLLSRYFKKSWPSNLVCGKPVWFSGHRLLMSIAVVLTILGFLFILVALQGAWVSPQEEARHFIHSVTGALVIGLAFFQPFIALFRCDPDSRYRFIFNYLHAFVGFSAFILSIATIFLATYFGLFKDGRGRTVMTVWTAWIILIFILFEVIQHYMRKKYGDIHFTNINASNKTGDDILDVPRSSSVTLSRSSSQQETIYEDKIKNLLLATHILIAAILSIYMSTLIG